MSHVILMSSSHVTKYSLTLIAQLLYDLMYKYPDKIYIQILWSNIVSYSSVNVLRHSELITLFQNKVQYSKRIVTILCSIKSNKANTSVLICRIAKRLNTWCGKASCRLYQKGEWAWIWSHYKWAARNCPRLCSNEKIKSQFVNGYPGSN